MNFRSFLTSAFAFIAALVCASSLNAQSCATTPFTYSMVQTPAGTVEVYLTSSQAFPFAIFTQGTQVGLKFPDGNQWGGSASNTISYNGNQGNGSWIEANFFDSPGCSSSNDYLIFKLGTDWTGTSFGANESKLIFTFEVPPPTGAGPFCTGAITLLESTDILVTTFGCTGSFNIAPNVEMFPLGPCNAFGGNTGPGVACDPNVQLPVELVTFNATKQDLTSLLTWETASEQNNAGFNVQRSSNGADWSNLGWIEGNGTSAQSHNYAFTDGSPLNGQNYYRLEQMDFDGQVAYSDIRNLVFGTGLEQARAFPNPTNGNFIVDIPSYTQGEVHIRAVDATGRLVFQQQYLDFSNTRLNLDFSALAPGVYQLSVRYPAGEDTLPLVLVKE